MTSPIANTYDVTAGRPTTTVTLSTGRVCVLRMPGLLAVRRYQAAARVQNDGDAGAVEGAALDAAVGLICQSLVDPSLTENEADARDGLEFYDNVLSFGEVLELLNILVELTGLTKANATRPLSTAETTTGS